MATATERFFNAWIHYYAIIRSKWAATPFKFQWQNLRAELLPGPGVDLVSPNFNSWTFLMYKQCKITDISKKLHNW